MYTLCGRRDVRDTICCGAGPYSAFSPQPTQEQLSANEQHQAVHGSSISILQFKKIFFVKIFKCAKLGKKTRSNVRSAKEANQNDRYGGGAEPEGAFWEVPLAADGCIAELPLSSAGAVCGSGSVEFVVATAELFVLSGGGGTAGRGIGADGDISDAPAATESDVSFGFGPATGPTLPAGGCNIADLACCA